jgi:hypothetical protein
MDNNASCLCLTCMTQRELGAFMRAVTDMYGPGEAEIAAGDWLDEFESIEELPECASRTLRLVTITAASRLASRLLGTLMHNDLESMTNDK